MMKRHSSRLCAFLIVLSLGGTASNCQEYDFGQSDLAAARKEAEKIRKDNKPPDPRVLESESYFLDAFKKKYKVDGKPFTLAGTFRKLLVCTEISKAMLKTVEDHGSSTVSELRSEWVKAEEAILAALAKENASEESALVGPEAEVWAQFLKQWRDDVEKTDDAKRFKAALQQAAYEIVKAGLKIQEGQEAAAKSEKASPSGSGSSGSGSRTAGGGSYPLHERADEQHLPQARSEVE